ncbi:GDYXXLXY domain-containing protein [Colwellia asteriadis]|uniref:GDYXXLXY domain-containing protein n=1 Tax=Colwellia asteriadis TaxID=517723 RepID=A0ABN1L4J8_9GAMM
MKNKISNTHQLVALLTLIIALTIINWGIYQKETLLAQGQVVYLELAPVDPRSLMQGDYMALRFAMADNINATLTSNLLLNDDNKYSASLNGFANVTINENKVASFVSITINDKVMLDTLVTNSTLTNTAIPLTATVATQASKTAATIPLQFRVRRGRVNFATNAYFFEEGTGEQLTTAIYGEFRVDDNGELLLVALRDKKFRKLGS